MLVYVEFITRNPGVSIEAFHFGANRGQTGWSGEYADDTLLLNMGRTFRLGPEPEYVAVWYTPESGIERVGDWERIFASGEADDFEETFRLVGRIERAGCYEPLLEPVAGREGLYYMEYLDIAADAQGDDIRSLFQARLERHPGAMLNVLCTRIGALAPGPRCLAVWTVPAWDAIDPLARDLDAVDRPVCLVDAAIYRDLGAETL